MYMYSKKPVLVNLDLFNNIIFLFQDNLGCNYDLRDIDSIYSHTIFVPILRF